MMVLGIETSCDETSAAVVKDGKVIMKNREVKTLDEEKILAEASRFKI